MPELAYVTYMPSINVTVGEKEDRMMITGMHSISDIFCVGCEEIVGWKYVRFLMIIFCDIISFVYRLTSKFYDASTQGAAYERSQKYKEGKFVLDR